MKTVVLHLIAIGLLWTIQSPAGADDKVLRVGIVGCDTSHVTVFTRFINDPQASGIAEDLEVTVAYPGGSDDLPQSRDRVAGFVDQLKKRGVKIVDSAEQVAEEADAILLESVDGRVHLAQFRAVARGKPVFVDKPAAASLVDVLQIFQIADATKTPCFSASALRFANQVTELEADKSMGAMIACETVGPLVIEPHHPDLFWYGVHGIEALNALMGTGCETVTRVDAAPSSLVVGTWSDGRIGSFRGLKQGKSDYAFTVYGVKGFAGRKGFSGYEPLIERICKFFQTGAPPVSRDDTIEIFAIMEAADESKRLGGVPVAVSKIIAQAEEKANNDVKAAAAAR